MLSSSLSGVDHANFGLRCTASDDERKFWECVDLRVGEFVELLSSHDGTLGGIRTNDLDGLGDSPGSQNVITSKPNTRCQNRKDASEKNSDSHMDDDAGCLASPDSA